MSSYLNNAYNPNVAGSGDNGGYTGAYQLSIERRSSATSLLASIVSTASSGTPAQGGIASANIGQTITINGSNLKSGEQLVFTALDTNGSLYESSVTAASVAADG